VQQVFFKLICHTCWNGHFKIECHQRFKNITGMSMYIKVDYWCVSHSKKYQYIIVNIDFNYPKTRGVILIPAKCAAKGIP